MFKDHKLSVKLDTENINVNHDINVNPTTFTRTHNLLTQFGKTTMSVIVVAAVAQATAEIATHIVKTKIK